MLKGLPLVQGLWVGEKRPGGRWVKELVFEPVGEERAWRRDGVDVMFQEGVAISKVPSSSHVDGIG